MSVKYYRIKRPIVPGTYPELQESMVLRVHNYKWPTYCEAIGRKVWGYIEYEFPLPPVIADSYDLVADGIGCTGCINEFTDRDKDCCWNCSRNKHSRKDLYKHRPMQYEEAECVAEGGERCTY